MLIETFSIFGTAMTFLYPNSLVRAGTTFFSNVLSVSLPWISSSYPYFLSSALPALAANARRAGSLPPGASIT